MPRSGIVLGREGSVRRAILARLRSAGLGPRELAAGAEIEDPDRAVERLLLAEQSGDRKAGGAAALAQHRQRADLLRRDEPAGARAERTEVLRRAVALQEHDPELPVAAHDQVRHSVAV